MERSNEVVNRNDGAKVTPPINYEIRNESYKIIGMIKSIVPDLEYKKCVELAILINTEKHEVVDGYGAKKFFMAVIMDLKQYESWQIL